MSGEHIRWDTRVADDHLGEIQQWRTFDQDDADINDGVSASLLNQFNGGAGTDQAAGIQSSHARLFDEMDSGHNAAINGLNDQQSDQSTGMQRAIARLSG